MPNRVPRLPNRILSIVIALATLFALPLAANAQTDQGRIAGTVADSNGALVPGAAIVVKNDRTGEERTAVTNDVGYFIVSALRPSTYTVSVSAKDLSAKTTNIELLVGQEFTLTMIVQPTGVAAIALACVATFSRRNFGCMSPSAMPFRIRAVTSSNCFGSCFNRAM